MSEAAGTPTVTHDESRHRFEIALDGERVGIAAYRDVDGRRHFTHTAVDPAYGGRGLAGTLVGHALAETRAAGLRIVPECSYVVVYLQRHQEYADLTDSVT
ncbi:GNAT family N-acetyltransferase [Leekyejoonella antrihumi]|uniref:N-acetyltransferase n=1 Tax=Leekyejoonella antrihumi TaxID=1660198 RepID=A0A563E7L2_9MICO|nr:GNAT family N-acetyltransferase [Leekyejoonella antrihumi]TWP38191.1 N-acetyltransferase [Leekyejoonella antrihumi]